MKKILFAGLFAVSLAAIAASPSKTTKKSIPSYDCTMYQNDTVPGKKDTTNKPIPDSINLKMP